jgi:hypothetical protein
MHERLDPLLQSGIKPVPILKNMFKFKIDEIANNPACCHCGERSDVAIFFPVVGTQNFEPLQ